MRWNSEWFINESNSSGGTRRFSPQGDEQPLLLLLVVEVDEVEIDGA